LSTILHFRKLGFYSHGKQGSDSDEVEELEQEDEPKLTNAEWQASRFYYSNINLLLVERGTEDILTRIEDLENKVSLEYMFETFLLFHQIHDFLIAEETKKMVIGLLNASRKYFDALSPDEMKQVDKKNITTAFAKLDEMLERVYKKRRDPVQKHMQAFRLAIGFKLLKLPFLQKRVEGLNEIATLCKACLPKAGHSSKEPMASSDEYGVTYYFNK